MNMLTNKQRVFIPLYLGQYISNILQPIIAEQLPQIFPYNNQLMEHFMIMALKLYMCVHYSNNCRHRFLK